MARVVFMERSQLFVFRWAVHVVQIDLIADSLKIATDDESIYFDS